MWFADEPSATLKQALQLLAQGKAGEAEMLVKKAAMDAKAKHGSGAHPLSLAYADFARLHFQMGDYQKAAVEFQHAAKGTLPTDPQGQRERLGFMYWFGAALLGLGKLEEGVKVLRQCVAFAKSVHGPNSPGAIVASVPLADGLMRAGQTAEAMKLAQEAYDELWKVGDELIVVAIPVRAEVLKAAGRADNPFTDLADLPDNLVAKTVGNVIARAPVGDPGRMRVVLSDLLAFCDKKYGDGHPLTSDALAAVAHHEARQGPMADVGIRQKAVRRAVWSFASRRVPGLLNNLEVGFEPDGQIHLVPLLSRDPNPGEITQLETVLTQAVDELYARPGRA